MNRTTPLVTVTTAVYNRADKIHRVFESMKGQTFRDFEHIIIDDGSTDNLKPLVEQYIREIDIPVVFIQKENGGKHTAINAAWKVAKGKYIVNLDSDDEMVPDALEKLVALWDQIPAEHRDEYWCVQGRDVEHKERKMIGEPYPAYINELSFPEAWQEAKKIKGDKTGLQRADMVTKYPFPEAPGVKFVTENVVWERLNRLYRTWYSNEIAKIVYQNGGDNLSKPPMTKQTFQNYYFSTYFKMLHRKEFLMTFREYLALAMRVQIFGNLIGKETRKSIAYGFPDFKNKFFSALLIIPGKIMTVVYKRKKNIAD